MEKEKKKKRQEKRAIRIFYLLNLFWRAYILYALAHIE